VKALTLSDLAGGGGVLELTTTGGPVHGVAVVDLDGDASPALIAAATGAAERSGRVLVGLAERQPPPCYAGLVEALAFTIAPAGTPGPALVPHSSPDEVLEAVHRLVTAAPLAATTLVRLLRTTSRLHVLDGLVAESLAYSTLLAGPEFTAWRDTTPGRPVPVSPEEPVLLERDDDTLRVTLNRPGRHNAYNRRMRDSLAEALELAIADPALRRVQLRGAGPSFCSGGDLDEFGTTPDVATAHVVRTERSAAALLHACRERVVARVHGRCIGAGVELPSFAGRVEAQARTTFQLPELRMGLVPGAGGTVGVTRRIGRWRTAYLALTACELDTTSALEWGLVDAVHE